MAAAAFIDAELTKAPLVVFSKTTCGYCTKVCVVVGASGVGWGWVALADWVVARRSRGCWRRWACP